MNTRWGNVRAWAVAALAAPGAVTGVALALALTPAPAAAHHNKVDVDLAADGCTLTAGTSWTLDEHQAETAALVVLADGEVHAAAVGDALEVDLAPGTTAVSWRVWGGGERDYDQPPLSNLDALVAHLDAGGGELDVDAPGVVWNELAVEGCEPEVESTPEPTGSADPGPTAEPTADPSEPVPGQAGGGDELPTTGAPLPLLVGGGVLLAGGGTGAVLVARRRRVSFTA